MKQPPGSRGRDSRGQSPGSSLFNGPGPSIAAAVLAIVLVVTYAFGHPFGIGAKITAPPTPRIASAATSAPVPSTTAGTLAPATPTTVSAYPAAAVATPTSVVAYPAANGQAPTATAVPNSASCEIQPARGFGLLYTTVPNLATRLGCATAPEAGISLTLQAYANGKTIDAPSQKQTYILKNGGNWSSHADGASNATAAVASLGSPSGSAQNVGGASESFQHGTMVWTPDHVIFVLFTDGGWEQHPDQFVDPTATPAPANQAAAPTRAAAPPSAVASCPVQPVRGFGLVYSDQPTVASRLGCASEKEIGFSASQQSFEHGTMIERLDTRQVFVVHADGSWSVYPDTFQNGQPLPSVGTPPANLVAPTGGIGLVWQQHADVRQALGWATGSAQNVSGASQVFAGGQMLWTSARKVYVLYSDKTGASFADQFVDPTPTPGH